MDFSSAIESINWIAVLLAALSSFIIGGLWYSLLFQEQWLAANNFTEEDIASRNTPRTFILAFLASFLIAFSLSMFIGTEGALVGAQAGFMTGFFFIFLKFFIIALFENRSLQYILVNGAYVILSLSIMGLIIGAFN